MVSLNTKMYCTAVVALILTSMAGCSDSKPAATAAAPAKPVLLIGVDGVEWNVVLKLLGQGQMPVIAGLMRQGQYGLLQTFEPTSSPIIWTTIATAKSPEEHGITGFTENDEQDEGQTLLTNADRRVKAIWNILSDYHKRVCVVGWWMTWPVEPINGVMVAQTNTRPTEADRRQLWKGTLKPGIPGQVYPPARQDEMLAVLPQVGDSLDDVMNSIFGKRPQLGRRGETLMRKTEWALRADETYRRIGLKLLKEKPGYDLTMIYFGGTDVIGHRFWQFMEPEAYAEPPEPARIEKFGDMIPAYYRHIDRVIGELIKAAPTGTTVFVISDHGMHAVKQSTLFTAHHHDAPPGFFLAAGPTIRPMAPDSEPTTLTRARLKCIGSVYDITPTLLAFLHIPLGADMRGHVLDQLFTGAAEIKQQPAPVATHDTPEFLANRPAVHDRDPGEAERLEQLRSLGYLGESGQEKDEPKSPASQP